MAVIKGKGLDKKQQTIILAAIFGLLVLYIYFQFFLKFSLAKLMELSSSINQQKANLVKSEALVGRKSEMEKSVVDLEARMEKYKISLPARSDMPGILQEISRIASESKIKILKMEPVKESKETAGISAPPMPAMPSMPGSLEEQPPQISGTVYTEIHIRIEANGGYHDLGLFINNIENAKNFMKISELDIDADSDSIYRHKINMVIVAYVLSGEPKGQ